MRVGAFSPIVVYLVSAVLGVVFGIGATRLATFLPRRYGITHVPSAENVRLRNLALVVLTTACSAGIASIVLEWPEATVARAGLWFSVTLVLVTSLLAAAAIDLEHMILPNEVTLGGTIVAIAFSLTRPTGIRVALAGALLGGVIAYLLPFLYRKIRGRSGAGGGDAKLTLLVGAWHGVQGVFFVLLAAALQQIVVAIGMRAFKITMPLPESVKAELAELRERAANGDAEAKELLADDPMAAELEGDGVGSVRLPFGPFLVLACLEFMFARTTILSWFAWLAS